MEKDVNNFDMQTDEFDSEEEESEVANRCFDLEDIKSLNSTDQEDEAVTAVIAKPDSDIVLNIKPTRDKPSKFQSLPPTNDEDPELPRGSPLAERESIHDLTGRTPLPMIYEQDEEEEESKDKEKKT